MKSMAVTAGNDGIQKQFLRLIRVKTQALLFLKLKAR
jgi:hypothetical protein